MSNLFRLSNILTEENSYDIVKKISTHTYLSESIDILRNADSQIFESTSQLYSTLLEADSRKEENMRFAEFFKEYQNTINNYILKIQGLASEFAINVETFADANKDILDDNTCGANIVTAITYKGAKYAHLLDSEVPDIEPYKAFKKEFAFIGKLMQDLGPIGTEEQKAQIIATVCNNLTKEINDGWLDKIIEKITDCDNCGKDSYAKAIYKTFVPEPSVDMSIDIGVIKQSKLDISNYKGYIDSISTSVDQFTDGLNKIATEIGTMFFRNQDHKLPIKTDVDGVEDKVYRLNDYSFNQMNMFISTKISQISELCNLYMVAIGIKMDCIMKYLQQCKDIIDTATHGVDNTPSTDGVDPGDDDVDNNENPDPDNDIPDEYDDDIQDFNTNDDTTDDTSTEDNQQADVVQDNSESEIEQECYLFEAYMYEKERAINRYVQQKSIYENMITEADAQDVKNAIQDKANAIGAFIDSIINQIKTLISRMKDALTKNYAPVIKVVSDNADTIKNTKIPEGWTIDEIKDDDLASVTLADFNVNDIDLLADKKKYYSEKYSSIIKNVDENTNSVKDMILSTIKGTEGKPYGKAELGYSVDFISKRYSAIAKNIDTMAAKLSTQKNAAQRVAQNASAIIDLDSTMKAYFEADMSEVPKDQQKATNKSDAGKTYFRLNSELITALMNINAMLMKKHLNFVSKISDIAGIKIPSPTLKKD